MGAATGSVAVVGAVVIEVVVVVTVVVGGLGVCGLCWVWRALVAALVAVVGAVVVDGKLGVCGPCGPMVAVAVTAVAVVGVVRFVGAVRCARKLALAEVQGQGFVVAVGAAQRWGGWVSLGTSKPRSELLLAFGLG